MEKKVITPNIVKSYLCAFLGTLSGEKLLALRKLLLNSTRVEELPADLRNDLHLKNYQLTRDLVQVILTEFDSLVPQRCHLASKLLTSKQNQLIREYILTKKQKHLEKWGADVATQKTEGNLANGSNLPSILKEYADFLFAKIQNNWKSPPNIIVALPSPPDDSGSVILLINHPIIQLSTCKDQLERWLVTLREKVTEIHFVASEIFLIDCSLENENWHGKNILIISNKIKCLPEAHVWDISGVPGEDGGSIMGIFNEIGSMENLAIISNGGPLGRVGGNAEEISLSQVKSLFPPSTNSDTLRNLVFQNAMNFGGRIKSVLYEPKDAYNMDTKTVTGHITDFYIEGETENGSKYFVGFRKGKWTTKNAFCLVQGKGVSATYERAGCAGTVTMVSMKEENITIALDELKLKVSVSADVGAGMVCKLEGSDVGYVALNSKQVVEYAMGRYQLKLEDEAVSESVYSKLLGKWVHICDVNKLATEAEKVTEDKKEKHDSMHERLSLSSSAAPAKQRFKNKNPQEFLQMYVDLLVSTDDTIVNEVISKHESDWWKNKILNSDE